MNEHTVSIILAIKLKELGFPQKTIHTWYQYKFQGELTWNIDDIPATYNIFDEVAAPLATEILEQLPEFIASSELFCPLHIIKCFTTHNKTVKGYEVYYFGGIFKDSLPDEPIFATTLPDALARMWIYLKENGLIK